MEKEFIPYEQALALKELGFDEFCLGFYNKESKLIITGISKLRYAPKLWTPTFSQAFRWFREKYELMSEIIWMSALPTHNTFSARIESSEKTENMLECNTYEEAELECLKKLIEIVKEK